MGNERLITRAAVPTVVKPTPSTRAVASGNNYFKNEVTLMGGKYNAVDNSSNWVIPDGAVGINYPTGLSIDNPRLETDGDFVTDSWDKYGSCVVWTSGDYIYDCTTTYNINQVITLELSTQYTLEFEISDYVSGRLGVSLLNQIETITSKSSNGIHTIIVTSSASDPASKIYATSDYSDGLVGHLKYIAVRKV